MKASDAQLEAMALEMIVTGDVGHVIENQEKQGQNWLVREAKLPRKCNFSESIARDAYDHLGIKIVDLTKGDDLFFDVELPRGWKIERTEHPMWTKLVDEKGRERMTIFYKAAFYDREAFSTLLRRFSFDYDTKSVAGIGKYMYSFVKDYDNTTIWQSDEILFRDKNDNRIHNETDWEIQDIVKGQAKKWLEQHYPFYERAFDYWDLTIAPSITETR